MITALQTRTVRTKYFAPTKGGDNDCRYLLRPVALPHFGNPAIGFEMHSLAPNFLDRLRFDATQLATLRAVGEYRGNTPSTN